MKVTVLLFGPYAATLNDSSVTLDIASSSCTAGEVKEKLAEKYPKLRDMLSAALIAVNHQTVQPNHAVCETDELAIIGLIGGG